MTPRYEIKYKGKYIEIFDFKGVSGREGEFLVAYSSLFTEQLDKIFGPSNMVGLKKDCVVDLEVYEDDYLIGFLFSAWPNECDYIQTINFRYDFYDRQIKDKTKMKPAYVQIII